MVGAVGIENNNPSIFKDLRGTMRKAKLLKRNEEAKEFLLLPQSSLKNPSFFSLALRFQSSGILAHDPRLRVGFGPKFCGADGKPTLCSLVDSKMTYGSIRKVEYFTVRQGQVARGTWRGPEHCRQLGKRS
jgi:hypothetical protein